MLHFLIEISDLTRVDGIISTSQVKSPSVADPQQTGKSSFQIVLDSLLGKLSLLQLIVRLHDQVSKIHVSVLVHSREIPMDHLTLLLVKMLWHPIAVEISMLPLVIRPSEIIQKELITLPSGQEH